ncbi:MAG TPA: hypothetical protein PKW49_11255 [Paludibacteraceae bacterium]|nr:hypothetical protein [Paludibacteraceae bacterium]HQF51284.1 hypothetical protein [Paludibacteraceae bacterium]
MKKFDGFTLADVIVTMIISMLITGIAFSIFRFSYNQLFMYQKENEVFQDLYVLHFAIQSDIDKAEQMQYQAGDLLLNSFSGEGKKYLFLDHIIVRESASLKDTFFFDTKDISATYDGNAPAQGIVDEFSFSVSMKQRDFPYKFTKKYPSEIVIK